MSPAGWERYRQLREDAGHSDKAIMASPEPAPHTWGVAGFYSPNLATDTQFAYDKV